MNRPRGYSQDDPRRQPQNSRRASLGGGPGPPSSMFSKIGGALSGGGNGGGGGAPRRRPSRSASPYDRRSGGGRSVGPGRKFGMPWNRSGGGGGRDYEQNNHGAEPGGYYDSRGGRGNGGGGRDGRGPAAAARARPSDDSAVFTISSDDPDRPQRDGGSPVTDDGQRGIVNLSTSRNDNNRSSRSNNNRGGGENGQSHRDPRDYMPQPQSSRGGGNGRGGGSARRRFPGGGMLPGGGMPGLPNPFSPRNGGGGGSGYDANWDGLSDYGGSRSSRAAGGGGVCKSGQHSRWVLPGGVKYAPRVDVWMALVATSTASVASVGHVFATTDPRALTSNDNFALATCALTLAAALGIGLSLRYGPMRGEATRPRFEQTYSPFVRIALSGTTYELMTLTVLAFFWLIAMPTICNGRASLTGVAFAVYGAEVWNANLFYSAWASFLLVVYLAVEVWSLHDRRAVVRAGSRRPPPNVLTKRWAYLTFVGFVVMGAALHIFTGPACYGPILKGTDYCKSAITGSMLGGLVQVLVGAGVGGLYRLSSAAGRAGMYNDAGITAGQRDRYGFAAAGVSLVLQGVNAGLVTGPLGGGPGTNAGALYFASWLGFAVAFELCLRYFDLAGTTPPRGGSSMGGGGGDARSVGSNRSGELSF